MLERSTAGSQMPSMRFSGKGVDHRSDVLVRDVLQVEGEMSWASNGEVRSDIAAVLRKRRNEKPDRTRSLVTLACPLSSASSPTRRAWLHERRGAASRNSSKEPHLFISSNGTREDLNGPRMLGEDSPGKGDALEQDLATRFQGKSGGGMERHDVGRVGAVGSDRLGDGGGELGEWALGRRRSFDPIETSRQDKRVDDLDLALTRPRPMAERIAKLSSSGQAPVDSGAIKARAEAEVPTKIPHGHPDLNVGSDVHPVSVTQGGPSSRAGAEEVALAG